MYVFGLHKKVLRKFFIIANDCQEYNPIRKDCIFLNLRDNIPIYSHELLDWDLALIYGIIFYNFIKYKDDIEELSFTLSHDNIVNSYFPINKCLVWNITDRIRSYQSFEVNEIQADEYLEYLIDLGFIIPQFLCDDLDNMEVDDIVFYIPTPLALSSLELARPILAIPEKIIKKPPL